MLVCVWLQRKVEYSPVSHKPLSSLRLLSGPGSPKKRAFTLHCACYSSQHSTHGHVSVFIALNINFHSHHILCSHGMFSYPNTFFYLFFPKSVPQFFFPTLVFYCIPKLWYICHHILCSLTELSHKAKPLQCYFRGLCIKSSCMSWSVQKNAPSIFAGILRVFTKKKKKKKKKSRKNARGRGFETRVLHY